MYYQFSFLFILLQFISILFFINLLLISLYCYSHLFSSHSSLSQIIHGPKSAGAEADTAATSKLELLGYNAGFRLIERLAKDYPKFKDELDLLKFICKDFWVAVFRWDISIH